MMEFSAAPLIGEVPFQDRPQAISLVLSYLPTDERCRQATELLTQASHQESPLFQGLFGAYRNGRLVGATFSQMETGKSAVIWLPRLTTDEPDSTVTLLFDAAWAYLRQHSILLAKTLLPLGDLSSALLAQRGGMLYIADLLYLVSQEKNKRFNTAKRTERSDKKNQKKFAPHEEDFAEIVTYNEANHERFVRVIEATYEGSLDCPALAGLQSVDDVLLDYRSIGVFDPHLWKILRHDNQDIGCLLLADHPHRNFMELLYLGLIPECRGRGLGKKLVGLAQQTMRQIGRGRLITAVDAANSPAIQTYTAMDFQTWQQRRLHVKKF